MSSPRATSAILATALALATSGCLRETWRQIGPRERIAADRVVLVGTIRLFPPIDESPGSIDVRPQKSHVFAMFTRDMTERFDTSRRIPLERYESAWVPAGRPFFLEVPQGTTPIYLRGFLYASGNTASAAEVPARIDLRRSDRVLYIGRINYLRAPPIRVTVDTAVEEARAAAAESGRAELLEVKWAVRPADPGEP